MHLAGAGFLREHFDCHFGIEVGLSLEVEAHSYFGALTRPEEVHLEYKIGEYNHGN